MATRANTFSWAGSAYATNPLAGGGNYDPRRPSLLPDTQEEDALVWEDVPKAMRTRLADIPEQIITKDTAYRNGVEVLRYFERDITEHTVRLQVDNKTMRKLLARDQAAERANPRAYQREANVKLAKSSLLGKDPWGDKEIPRDLLGGRTRAAGALTVEGELLAAVQDINHRYARVHLRRILHASMWQRITKREQFYRQDPARLDGFANKRMP